MNPLQISLKGLGLIEASAGTGKTYTITALYLRLLLEQSLAVEQILVVTYTKAATAELKERIRERLVEARSALRSGVSKDSLICALIDSIDDREQAERQLNAAILSFDRAAIYTIHGFCQRALTDHAFESGQPFERELEPDQSALIREVVDDFWRRELCDAAPGFSRYLIRCNITPNGLLAPISSSLDKTQLEVCGRTRPDALEQSEAVAQQHWLSLRELWQNSSTEIMALLLQAPLSKVSYKPAQISQWQQLMSVQLQAEQLPSGLFAKFENFTADKLVKSTNKGKQPPEHPFFKICQQFYQTFNQLQQGYSQQLIALRGELRRYLLQELPKRKSARHIQTYDDLLTDLLQALQREGDDFAAALRQRYQAALIDEFQDTDPVQYRIFSSIYAASDCPLFYVGDPKQAIYGFRGADIFAYLQARREAEAIHTLDTNWRSVPGLINSVNQLFSGPQSFLLDGIHYSDVYAADKKGDALQEQDGEVEPFRFRLIEAADTPLTKAAASEIAADDTAEEITRLLNLGQSETMLIGERPLTGGDIAVLVRDHRQAELISDKLLQRGIFSVQSSQASVFASAQALELERLLLAMAEPGREPLIKAALATDLLGFDAIAVAQLSQNERQLDEQIEQFNAYHRLWSEQSFATLFRHLLNQRAVAQRLLGFVDGERRLTNLLHLAELIQQQEQSHQSGMHGLINWLSQQRREPPKQNEASQLRLESDENLVQILTIHKSKGLQFPIVFCPFLWDGRLRNKDKKCSSFTFHDLAKSEAAQLELGSEQIETHRSLAVREEMAENLRLLYVALTRAQYRCYVSWGYIKNAEHSAMSWLLHPPVAPEQADAIDVMAAVFKKLGHEGITLSLTELAAKLPDALRIDPALTEGGRRYGAGEQQSEVLTARDFSRQLRSTRRLTSFSALTAGIESDLPDYDAHTSNKPLQNGPQQRSGFTFPRGARAGCALHDIFEHLDFTQAEPASLAPLVETTLQRYGFTDEWQPVACSMVNQVLDSTLDAVTTIRLRDIPNGERLNELEFCFPLSPLSGRVLQQLLVEHEFAQHEVISQAIKQLNFKQIEGFLKGFIDLIFEANGRFYLVDYKSNWLGDRREDYGLDAMSEAMAEHSYYLQYLLYVVALHRYLGSRLPDYSYETHFGEVYYLFLRGMQPGCAETGIYRDRPSLVLIEALDRLFREGATNG
ncbi:MAG: exodeoxyribonuclease V subunit beta [Candidatus Polarisedimenticolaceae bacterium]|nr:exodeoxyribonuclease V subunit beta [Candidatus Polarisedimenticolaceae bacterium]